jgi:probable HAF family extracellular repeat protein
MTGMPWRITAALTALAVLGLGPSLPAADQPYTLISLGTLGGTGSAGFGINVRAQAVGASTTAAGAAHAYLWENGTITDLGTLGGSESVAFGINNGGQVVGASYTAGNAARHAFLWDKGRMTDLGTLGGSIAIAYAINNQGQVVGEALPGGAVANHAFLWENGKMTDLGTLGGLSSAAVSINNLGQVVGYAVTALQRLHAFSWDSTGGMKDLNSQIAPGSGWELVDAPGLAVSDAGEIMSDGNFKLQRLAYVLTPPAGNVLTRDAVDQSTAAIALLLQDVKKVNDTGQGGALLYLMHPLTAAQTRLSKGETAVATNLLQAFINQVDALISGRPGGPPLARSDGQRWIDAAQAILARLRV